MTELPGSEPDIRAAGMEVTARPLPDDPSHAETTSLTYVDRKSKQAIEWRTLLAEQLSLRVEGPFSTSAKPKDQRD